MRKRFSFGSSAAEPVNSLNMTSTNVTGIGPGPGPGPGPGANHSSPLIPTTFSDNLPLPSIFVFDLDYTLWPFWVDTHCSPPLKPVSTISSSSTATASSSSNNEVNKLRDRHGEDFGFYETVPPILWAARQRGIIMSIASRTQAPQLAETMLRSLTVSAPPLSPGDVAGPPPPPPTTTSSSSMPPNSFFNNSSSNRLNYDNNSISSGTSTSNRNSNSRKPFKAITLFTAPQIYPGSKVTHFKKIQGLIPKSALLSSSSSSTRSSSTIRSSSRKRRTVSNILGSGRKNNTSNNNNNNNNDSNNDLNIPDNQDPKNGVGARTPAAAAAAATDIPFEDMIFFDDEARNRNVETELGVTFVLVNDGLTRDEIDRGVWEWRRRRLGIVHGQEAGDANRKDQNAQRDQAK